MDESLRRQYLDAMGIQNWVQRNAAPEPTSRTVPVTNTEPTVAERLEPDPPADAVPPWLADVPPPTEEWVPMEQPEAENPISSDGISGLGWKALEDRVVHCERCELHKTRTRTVFGVGNRSADLMVIGEAPGVDEDRQGEPFVGRAGQLLNAMLSAIGLQRDQVFIANVLKCRPPDNRDPRPEEALQCEPFLRRQVTLISPKVILAVGRVAAQNLLKSQEAVGRMRGRDYRFDNIPLVVTYHPAYLLRSPQQKSRAWQDLQRAVALLRN